MNENKRIEKELKKRQRSKGQSLVEYGLILALVSVVAITVLRTMGDQIKTTVNQITGQLEQANQAAQAAASGT